MKNEVRKSNSEIEKQTAKVKALEKQVNSFSITGVNHLLKSSPNLIVPCQRV